MYFINLSLHTGCFSPDRGSDWSDVIINAYTNQANLIYHKFYNRKKNTNTNWHRKWPNSNNNNNNNNNGTKPGQPAAVKVN